MTPELTDRWWADDRAALRRMLDHAGVPTADADAYLATFAERDALDAAMNWYRAAAAGGPGLRAADTPAVSVPVLYLWGTADQSVGRQAAELTAEHVTGPYRFVEIEFDAMTNLRHVGTLDARDTHLKSCEIDLRPGGRFRFVMGGPGDTEFAFSGEYLEVERPSRIVNTWVFEPFPDSPAQETATWDEQDGRTTVRLSIRFQTVEDYAGWAGSGAFGGWAETLDRLAETIAGLSAARG